MKTFLFFGTLVVSVLVLLGNATIVEKAKECADGLNDPGHS